MCGPFNMVFEDIPTPIGFWLGFFPITDKKKSGIIFPTFGQNLTRGIYLSHGGYYWAVNDYLGIQAVGDIYSNGSFLVNTDATYIKKYKYRGTADLSLAKLKNGFGGGNGGQTLPTQFNLAWTHTTMAKRSGNFLASVNLSSSKYAKGTIATPNRTNNITSSSVTYNRAFGHTPFNTSISMRASQNNY
ncbi:MAG TPA: putative LPS assembly protein LptD, partial [Cytophagaceae bacterium]|nr:putative LPS assembly protein LptD [Cytophagaceae bacterium]